MEGELRKQLRDTRLSIRNKRHSLAQDEGLEVKLVERLDELSKDAEAAFARTREIGREEIASEEAQPQQAAETPWQNEF